MDKGLKILFWNVRSLYNKIDTFRLEIDKVNPDILNVCETWLHNDIESDFVSIKDYVIIRSDRTTLENGIQKRGGGLCTYVRKSLICEDLIEHTISNINIELHVVKYCLPYTRPIYIFNVYRPPAGDVDEFISALNNSIGIYRNHKCDIFVGGDFNIDIQRTNSIDTKKLVKFFKLIQLKQEICTVTRPDSNAILDLIATNCDIIKESGTLDINISDHLPIFIIHFYCVTTHNPNNPPLREIITKNWEILGKTKTTRPLLDTKIIFGLRRNKNLSDQLVRASTSHSDGTMPPLSETRLCHNKNKCRYCPLLNTSGKFKCKTDSNTYDCKSHINCQSSNIIYLITCRSCGIQYVGQTKNKLLTRFQSHHFDIKHNNDTTVARHFNRCPKPIPGKFEGMEISILSFFQQPPSSRASQELRDREEKRWIHRLSSVVPRGLNLLD